MALPKLLPSSKILAKDAKAMIAGGGWSRDERLSRALLAQIWRHDDGRALTRFADGACRVYESHAELTAWYDEADRHAQRGFRWEDVIPDGPAFPKRVPALIRALPQALDLTWTASRDELPELDMVEREILEYDRTVSLRAFVEHHIRVHGG